MLSAFNNISAAHKMAASTATGHLACRQEKNVDYKRGI